MSRVSIYKERSKAYPAALQQAMLSEGLLYRRLAHISLETLRKTLKVTHDYEKPPPLQYQGNSLYDAWGNTARPIAPNETPGYFII